MKVSATSKLIFAAMVATAATVVSSDRIATAQQPTAGRVPHAMNMTPAVELPSVASEAGSFVHERRAPSGAMPGDYRDYGPGNNAYTADDFSGVSLEPTPAGHEPGFGESYITDTGTAYGMQPAVTENIAPLYSTGSWWWRGRWYASGEVVVFDRTDYRQLNLAVTSNGVVFGEDVARHNASAGMRIRVGRFLGRDAALRDHMVEANYLGGFKWNDGRTFGGEPGNISVNSNIPFSDATIFQSLVVSDSQSFFYDSDLNDFQFNYRMQARPGKDVLAMQPDGKWVQHAVSGQLRSVLGGLRYTTIGEKVNYVGSTQATTSQTQTTNNLDDTVVTSDQVFADEGNNTRYTVKTNNDLFGLHFGGEVTEKYESWSWGIRGRIGGLVNFVERRSTVVSDVVDFADPVVISQEEVQRTNDDGELLYVTGTGDDRVETTEAMTDGVANDPLIDTIAIQEFSTERLFMSERVTDERFSFVVETGVFGTYQLRPNLAFRGGYDVMLYTHLALASENLGAPAGFRKLNSNGTGVYHGGFFGFETTW